jgi:hypothetical protein
MQCLLTVVTPVSLPKLLILLVHMMTLDAHLSVQSSYHRWVWEDGKAHQYRLPSAGSDSSSDMLGPAVIHED